jgi:uncharacterized protein DUF4154
VAILKYCESERTRSSPCCDRRRRFVVARILLALSLLAAIAGGQTTALSESQIKAGFLFNFTKFVDWPPGAFADVGSPIVLGIIGENTLGDLLTQAAVGKTINGRIVVVRRFKEDEELQKCSILFISASEQKQTAHILEKLKSASVLTVGEADGFAQMGGMINFYIDGNKVRLEINLEAASRARLKISAKVIAVARLVGDSQPRGKNPDAIL